MAFHAHKLLIPMAGWVVACHLVVGEDNGTQGADGRWDQGDGQSPRGLAGRARAGRATALGGPVAVRQARA